jgi:hypothetical protein
MPVSIEQLRKSRRRDVTVGRWTFTVEVLPTDALFALMQGPEREDPLLLGAKICKECVVGWSGVLERDIVPSGTDDPLPFNRDLFREWVADRDDLWDPIANTMYSARTDLHANREADTKN